MKIALLGAESTGKTALAQALALGLPAPSHSAVMVTEYLREWCTDHKRTPKQTEQIQIAQEQMHRIEAAANQGGTVVADTTPLMTAVYSDYVFGDTSLYGAALAYQKSFDATLVMGLDIAWQPDGIQRDGPHVRTDVDALVRRALQAQGIAYRVVYGQGEVRLQHALAALGLSSATQSGAAYAVNTAVSAENTTKKWQWVCDKCSDPDCEHKLFTSLQKTG